MTSGAAPTVSAVVLAAGASSRLGEPKQSVMLDGQSLLMRAAQLASSCVDGDVHVVVGANAAADARALDYALVQVHPCSEWAQGQSASLSLGLSRIAAGHAAVVLVVDQYRLRADHLRRLLDAWRADPQRPAAARYADTLGVPVVWPPALIETLVASRCLGRDMLAAVSCTEVALPAARFDLDTPQDLAQLRRYEQSRSG